MEAMVQEITGVKVVSLHHDISTLTGEESCFSPSKSRHIPRGPRGNRSSEGGSHPENFY